MRLTAKTGAGAAVAILALVSVLTYLLTDGSSERMAPGLVVLAKVNGEPITDEDVDLALERTFSTVDLMLAGQDLRDKVLDSLIASRAMKQAVAKEMSEEEIEGIRRKVRAYQEELFVKEYLQRHAAPEPVTAEMVAQYYGEHPEQFGAEALRDFELLKAPAKQNEAARDKLLNAIPAIRGEVNWTKVAKSLAAQYGLQYQQGRSKTGLLHPKLDEALQRLDKGATSDVIYIDGQLHLVRLRDVTRTSPKPLSEVSADIRKKLAPRQLKKAVRQLSERARSEADVEILSVSRGPIPTP